MMKKAIFLLTVLLVLFSAEAASETKTPPQNLIIVLWDGTQRRHLLQLLRREKLPRLATLIEKEGLGLPVIDSETCMPTKKDKYSYRTLTGPGNSAIVTGLGYKRPWPGMRNWHNRDPHPIPDGLTLFEYLKARGYSTALVSTKTLDFWPYVPLENAKPEIDFWRVAYRRQWWPTNRALRFIENAKQPFFLWLHYQEPDELGHLYRENSREYNRAIKRDDRMLGILLKKLKRLGIYENTLVVVTTDHGFKEGGRQHNGCLTDNKDLFLVVSANGPQILGCVRRQTDIAPCLKDLIGQE